MADLSILIPARSEMFLARTIEDILKNIEADTEVIAVLDGVPANPPIKQHERVSVITLHESVGQRAATNLACKLSKAKYIMKVDAHCSFDPGFDKKMIEAFKTIGDNATMVPVMRNLWAFDWKCYHCGWKKYQGPTPIKCEQCGKTDNIRRKMLWIGKRNPQSTSYCFDSTPHFQYFEDWKHRPAYEKDKKEKRLTETMSLQGSCWMLTRQKYWELGICDEKFGSWGSQGIEVAVKTWLSGGCVLVNHKTWYAHMFRTQGGDFGFPYQISNKDQEKAKAFARDLFFNNKWEKQVHPLSWLIEKFWPVKGWTEEDLKKLKANTFRFSAESTPTPAESEPTSIELKPAEKLSEEGIIFYSAKHQTTSKEDRDKFVYNTGEMREKKVKKTIFTLNIGNYQPEITNLTYPFIEDYARKIDAEFVILKERKFPNYPMMYEKLQIYELGKGNDWNIYVDSDCLIHPDLFDITEIIPEDTVMTYGVDFANGRFKYDNYFRRDGRNIGTGNFLTIAPKRCIDIWEPLTDITLPEAIGNIRMTHREETLGHKPGYGIDDYVISRNIAKYGLKFKTFLALLTEIKRPDDEYFFHNHLVTETEKVELIKKKIHDWRF